MSLQTQLVDLDETLNVPPPDCAQAERQSTLPTGKRAFCIDPLHDHRWEDFVEKHPRASLFHTPAWLRALSKTYGYCPIVYTTSPDGQPLRNGIVFCQINSWLTGRRLVSLPFSDHCEPLIDTRKDFDVLSAALNVELQHGGWDYLEFRPLGSFDLVTRFCRTRIPYAFHQLDLRPDMDIIFQNLHKSSTQRKIRRAARERLKYREGSTKDLLDDFYKLFIMSRKRQGLAPQPKRWFANLVDCFGSDLKIRVALKNDRAIAAMITIQHNDTLTYKYGCSDFQCNKFGSMHLLLWNTILDAKHSGLKWLDFGRTNADQQGLITFKNRWGATQSVLTYSRYGPAERATHLCDIYGSKIKSFLVTSVLRLIPHTVLPVIGNSVYKHIG